MNKFKEGLIKVGKFLKRNIYYVLIIVCVVAVGTMVTVTLTRKPKDGTTLNPDPGNEQEKPEPIIFIDPVADAEIGLGFNDTELVFSKTLKQWSAHLGMDFHAEEGAPVVAVYDGKVKEIYNDQMLGNVVVIEHENDLVTKYYSLGDEITVKVDQEIEAGTKIGVVSDSMLAECEDGPHLHFETLKSGELVNPQEFFVAEEK